MSSTHDTHLDQVGELDMHQPRFRIYIYNSGWREEGHGYGWILVWQGDSPDRIESRAQWHRDEMEGGEEWCVRELLPHGCGERHVSGFRVPHERILRDM